MPPHFSTIWCKLIGEFIGIECITDNNGDPVPYELSYDIRAKASLYEWQKHNTDLCNSELDERLVGIYSKLEIYISRFSLVLQLINWVCGDGSKDFVELKSIEGAIELVEYFRKTSQKILGFINNYPVEQLNGVQKAIFKSLPDIFTTAEGVAIATNHNIAERTFKDFLNRHINSLFRKDKHGVYSKINH